MESSVAQPVHITGEEQNSSPICSFSWEPGECPMLCTAILSERENRLTINHRLIAKIECQSKVYEYQVYKM